MTRVADPPPINPDPNAPGPITPCDTHPAPVVPTEQPDPAPDAETIPLDSAE